MRTGGVCRRGVIGASVALGALLAARAAAAQGDPWDYHNRALTRQQLTQILARYQAAAQSPVYSADLHARVLRDADSISARLRNGDMRVGDRIRLRVDGQASLTDTFAVSSGPALVLPVVGSVDLSGVLRSELEGRITQSVDNVYHDTPVHVQLLTRLAVLGGVVRPGFYALPREALVDDAITAAGGLAGDGSLSAAYIERGRDRLVPADSLQLAMRERKTLEDLDLQAGDRIVVPTVLPSDPTRTAQLVTYLLSTPLSLYALFRLF